MSHSRTYYIVRGVCRWVTALTIILGLTLGGQFLAQVLIHLMTGK